MTSPAVHPAYRCLLAHAHRVTRCAHACSRAYSRLACCACGRRSRPRCSCRRFHQFRSALRGQRAQAMPQTLPLKAWTLSHPGAPSRRRAAAPVALTGRRRTGGRRCGRGSPHLLASKHARMPAKATSELHAFVRALGGFMHPRSHPCDLDTTTRTLVDRVHCKHLGSCASPQADSARAACRFTVGTLTCMHGPRAHQTSSACSSASSFSEKASWHASPRPLSHACAPGDRTLQPGRVALASAPPAHMHRLHRARARLRLAPRCRLC